MTADCSSAGSATARSARTTRTAGRGAAAPGRVGQPGRGADHDGDVVVGRDGLGEQVSSDAAGGGEDGELHLRLPPVCEGWRSFATPSERIGRRECDDGGRECDARHCRVTRRRGGADRGGEGLGLLEDHEVSGVGSARPGRAVDRAGPVCRAGRGTVPVRRAVHGVTQSLPGPNTGRSAEGPVQSGGSGTEVNVENPAGPRCPEPAGPFARPARTVVDQVAMRRTL